MQVSKICLGCMSYGDPGRGGHQWSLDEEASRPFFRQAIEAGINFFDTANVYSDGTSEEITGRALAELGRARRAGDRHQGARADARRPERGGPVTQGDPRRSSTTACADWAPTTSTSIRSTAGTTARRSPRRWRCCTTSSRPARCATSARRRCTPGSSPRRSTPPGSTAGRRSPRCRTTTTCCYREEEREMLPLCADLGVGVIPWSPLGTRPADPRLGRHDGAQRDRRVRPWPLRRGRPGDRRR